MQDLANLSLTQRLACCTSTILIGNRLTRLHLDVKVTQVGLIMLINNYLKMNEKIIDFYDRWVHTFNLTCNTTFS